MMSENDNEILTTLAECGRHPEFDGDRLEAVLAAAVQLPARVAVPRILGAIRPESHEHFGWACVHAMERAYDFSELADGVIASEDAADRDWLHFMITRFMNSDVGWAEFVASAVRNRRHQDGILEAAANASGTDAHFRARLEELRFAIQSR